ncbi:response regulator [Rhizobiaceae bacterium]|nr:response regulator [Rhizobiaceae bacterium]
MLSHSHYVAPMMRRPNSDAGGAMPTDRQSMSLEGLNVLLVEDEMMIAMELGMAIEDAEANVVGPVNRLSLGMALVSDETVAIDVAILDVDLHGKDVFPLAEVLMSRGIPFLFHTGHATREELAAQFPDAPVCPKPMLVDRVLQTAASLVT